MASLNFVQILARISSQVCLEKLRTFGDSHTKVIQMLHLGLQCAAGDVEKMAAACAIFRQKMQMPTRDVDALRVLGRPEADHRPGYGKKVKLRLAGSGVDEPDSPFRLAYCPRMRVSETTIDTDGEEQIIRSAQSVELLEQVIN